MSAQPDRAVNDDLAGGRREGLHDLIEQDGDMEQTILRGSLQGPDHKYGGAGANPACGELGLWWVGWETA